MSSAIPGYDVLGNVHLHPTAGQITFRAYRYAYVKVVITSTSSLDPNTQGTNEPARRPVFVLMDSSDWFSYMGLRHYP